MDSADSFLKDAFWRNDSFRFLKLEEFESHGIVPSDIPQGTFPALKHPTHLQSRYGGNAYGFGLFEIYDRLKPKDIKLLHSISFDNQEAIKKHYGELNKIYKQAPRLDAVGRGLGVSVHRVGTPQHGLAALAHGLDERVPVRAFFGALEHWYTILNELAGR